jgi:hypothetical protein
LISIGNWSRITKTIATARQLATTVSRLCANRISDSDVAKLHSCRRLKANPPNKFHRRGERGFCSIKTAPALC